jgi:hypothetical protein
LNFVFAASILDELHLNIQTTDSNGNVITGTYNFDFNISTTSDCNNVIYSDSATLTTDSRGIISYYLENVNLDYDNQYYLCYYRNGVLINNSKISRTPYAFRSKYVNTSGIEVDSNLDLSGYNFTADYIFGDGSGLTNLNVSAIDLSNYVPYTGANQNLVLGSNNFSVNTNTLFVDSGSGFVGVGTASPNVPLSVFSDSGNIIHVQRSGQSLFNLGAGSRLGTDYIRWGKEGGAHFVLNEVGGVLFGTNVGIENLSNGDLSIVGNLGVGTVNPSSRLNVIGDGNVTGTMYANAFVGDGSGLTNLNISSLDMSDYYTSAQIESFGYYNLSSFDINDYYLVSNPNNYLNETTLNVSGINYWTQIGNDLYYNAGNIGVGTSTPQNALNVIGEINATGNITSQADICLETGECLSSTLSSAGNVSGSGVSGQAAFWTSDDALSSDGNFTWDNSNKRLGIGTGSPSTSLDINGGKIKVSDTSTQLQIVDSDDSKIWTWNANAGSFMIYDNTNGASPFKITGTNTQSNILSISGNKVGINTSSPSSLLHIAGTPGVLSSGLTFGDGDTGIYEGIDDALVFRVNGNDLWQTQGTTFKAASNSGIRFDSGNPTSTSPNLMPSNNDLNTGLGWAGQDQLSLIAGGVEGIRVGSTNVTSNNDLYVSGDLNATGDVCASGGCLNDVVSGNVSANSSNYWDGLDTPADISGSQIDNDLNWINATGAVIAVGNWSADKVNYYTKTETYNQSEVDDMITSGTVNNSEYLDGYDSSFFMPLNTSVSGDFDFNGGWTGGGVSIVDGDIYAQAGYFYQINSLEVSTLEVNGSLIPDLDNSFDVGNSTFRWRDGYFSGEVTADSFIGDGSGLTNLNVSAIDLSDYVPYTGANQNLILGANNFSVNTNTLFVDSNSGKIGIGEVNPGAYGAPLTIDVTPSGSGGAIYINDAAPIRWAGGSYIGPYYGLFSLYSGGYDMTFRGYNGTDVLDILYMDKDGSSGKIGIGTSTPQNTLNVIGEINATGNITSQADICLETGECLSSTLSSAGNVSGSGVSGQVAFWTSDNALSSDGNFTWDNSNKRLGIGTTSPQQELHVNGSLQLTDNVISPDSVTFDTETSVGMRLTNPNGYISLTPLNGGWAHIYTDRPRYIFNTDLYVIGGKFASYSTADLTLSAGGVRNDLVIDNDNGNVGINTTTPQNTLNVVGDLNVTGTIYGASFDGVESNWNVSGSNLYPADLSKNVGIGTDTPSEKLDVNGSVNIAINQYYKTNTNNILGQEGGNFKFGYIAGNTYFQATTLKDLDLYSDGTKVMHIENSTKNVGIGTDTPTEKLEVSGTAKVTGSMIIGTTNITTSANGDVQVW